MDDELQEAIAQFKNSKRPMARLQLTHLIHLSFQLAHLSITTIGSGGVGQVLKWSGSVGGCENGSIQASVIRWSYGAYMQELVVGGLGGVDKVPVSQCGLGVHKRSCWVLKSGRQQLALKEVQGFSPPHVPGRSPMPWVSPRLFYPPMPGQNRSIFGLHPWLEGRGQVVAAGNQCEWKGI